LPLSAGPAVALRAGEAAMADTVLLAEAHSGADLGTFRAVLTKRRPVTGVVRHF
jgi:hypothetical protein